MGQVTRDMPTVPVVSTVNVHHATADSVRVESAGETYWLQIGPVAFFGTPDELAAIGHEIVRQAS